SWATSRSATHRSSEFSRIDPRIAPLQTPVHMRSGRAAGRADGAEPLSLNHPVPDLHIKPLAMEEGTAQPHAMVDDQQIALEREGRRSRKHDNAIGRRDKRSSRRHRDIGAAVIGTGLTLIDALRTKEAREAPF